MRDYGYGRGGLYYNTGYGDALHALGTLIPTTGMVERLFRPNREGTTRAAESRPDDRNATPAAGTPASPDTGLSEEELQKSSAGINNRDMTLVWGT